jgi:hypothetical protein
VKWGTGRTDSRNMEYGGKRVKMKKVQGTETSQKYLEAYNSLREESEEAF